LREADPQLYEDMKKYGRRNIACLTIAPTGTTSLMTQTTSGIEPVFLPVYKRRRKVNPNDTNVHVDFVDETEMLLKNILSSTPNLLHGWKRKDTILPNVTHKKRSTY
jgi:ribonucleotide reductase alpha subunit